MTHLDSGVPVTPEDEPTFCDAVIQIELPDGSLDDVRCSDRYRHLEAHSAKIWWSS